ncbi:myocardin-like [Scleropages formosus]|uniref:Myocardin-like n=1 Tax=Scleropages formosus TaxID=113540 RepID=A0A0P7Z2A0_SCLFO|nr:myocardin-like [Scleropages formosus]
MTLLASERSLLIRNKFRSVLQLRIQNRRQQNEVSADAGVKTTNDSQLGEKESSSVCLPDDNTTQKLPPSGLSTDTANSTAQDWGSGAGQKQKRARLAEDLSEKIQRRPGPLELLQKHILPLETAAVPFPQLSDLSEDEISCCSSSSSPEQLGVHQSPSFSASPGVTGDQSLSDLSPGSTVLSQSPTHFQCSLALPPATEDINQPMTVTVVDSDSLATSRRAKGIFFTTQATPLLPKTAQPPTSPPPQSTLGSSVPPTRPPRSKKPRDSKPKMKKLKYHQYIPPDQRGGTGGGVGGGAPQRSSTSAPPIDPAYSRLLQQQQVSELRQQLRKRGLPVSGTKPSLLERLRPYQLPRPCLPPVPLCPPATPSLAANMNQNSPSDPASAYIPHNNMATRGSPNGSEQSRLRVGFLTTTPATTVSSLSLPSSSPLSSGTSWRSGQAAEELSVELEMRERMRSRPRERPQEMAVNIGGDSVLCCQPCDVIGQDFELPMQITASPPQITSGGRSLEEELQEAIQRVLMAPSQSIDDILDEPISCTDAVSSVSELQAAAGPVSGTSSPSLIDQSNSFPHPPKDENLLSSPLCSSLLLELPPSPSNISQLAPPQPPPPPPICTTPPTTTLSRKRREAATFDPADWLESLTSGLRPLTPPAAPFVETDFGLDSDLNVNRVLDMMVEQW